MKNTGGRSQIEIGMRHGQGAAGGVRKSDNLGISIHFLVRNLTLEAGRRPVTDEGVYPTYAGNSYESTRAADRSLAL
jgi:hypothetical protein